MRETAKSGTLEVGVLVAPNDSEVPTKVEAPPGRGATNNNQNRPPLESQHTSSVQDAQPRSLLELQTVC